MSAAPEHYVRIVIRVAGTSVVCTCGWDQGPYTIPSLAWAAGESHAYDNAGQLQAVPS